MAAEKIKGNVTEKGKLNYINEMSAPKEIKVRNEAVVPEYLSVSAREITIYSPSTLLGT